MSCSACGHPIPERAKFCNECGAAVASRCSGCGAELPPAAKFCNECGSPTGAGPVPEVTKEERPLRDVRAYTPKHLAERILQSRSALEGERKQVTVLFADVKGSMELAEQLGAEAWHDLLDRFFEILSDGVHRFEGTINQYTGDGIMALFGAPIAHEDHAQRALLGDSDNPIEQVSFHTRAGQLRALRGDASGALEHGRQALEWGMKSQNLFIRSVAHSARGRGLLSAGRLDEALEQLEQSLVLAIDRAQGKHYAVGEGVPLLAEIQLRRGDIPAARAAAERGLELACSMGYRHSEARNGILMARALAAGGDAAGAECALAHASELATALAARDLLPRAEEARAELARLRGDDAACEQALRAAARIHRENGEEWQATQAEARIGA